MHGGLSLPGDVERIVLDPSFRGTAIERAAATLGVPVAWHPGLELRVDRIEELEAYRGVETLALAVELAVDGAIDARILGEAAGAHNPQAIKRVWHLIARFGHRLRDEAAD